MNRLAASSALVLSLLVLTSCVTTNPGAAQQPPGFASDADAIAATEKVLDQYVHAISDSTSRRDGELAPFEGLMSTDLMEAEVASLEKRGERTSFAVGEFDYFSVDLTQVELSADNPTAFVRLRLCLDYRDVRWVNAAGEDITAADRSPWRAVEIAFVDDPSAPNELLVDDINWWVGYDFCPTPRERGEVERP
jgi:hypothetical protein